MSRCQIALCMYFFFFLFAMSESAISEALAAPAVSPEESQCRPWEPSHQRKEKRRRRC